MGSPVSKNICQSSSFFNAITPLGLVCHGGGYFITYR